MRCVRPFVLVSLFLSWLVPSAVAQQIRFIPDFSSTPSTNRLQFNGSQLVPYQSQLVLRLTQENSPRLSTTTYFKIAQPVVQGFSTYFAFQMHHPTMCCSPGDGFAFIFQNSTATDSSEGASGRGLFAVGAAMGGVGYSGINDSLAVEFDILDNPWDPNSNHIAIQSCGGDPSKFNSPVHVPGEFTIGDNHHVTSCLLSAGAINGDLGTPLGPTCNDEDCTDGPIHQVVIDYVPPMGEQQGALQVYLDPMFQPGTHTPVLGSPTVLNVPYNMVYSPSNPLGLVPFNLNQLLVGFTASVENGGTTTDILAWEFTTHSPVQVTQILPPGGTEADFSFGGHQMAVKYPPGFQNPNGITMTVLETPTNQQVFHDQRLVGTQFANENCIIYLQTGGNCIVYSVTCHDAHGNQITCPTESEPTIDICSQFYTSEPVSQLNTDFLEAEPIGSNNWCSIWTGFMPQDPRDGIVSGRGMGFSDIVAMLSPAGPGPSCSGDLKTLTKMMERTTLRKPQTKRSTDSGFCNPQ